jgi:hypothetical protein
MRTQAAQDGEHAVGAGELGGGGLTRSRSHDNIVILLERRSVIQNRP